MRRTRASAAWTAGGCDYDRSPGLPNPPHEAGPPDGTINLQEVVLKQVSLACAEPPWG